MPSIMFHLSVVTTLITTYRIIHMYNMMVKNDIRNRDPTRDSSYQADKCRNIFYITFVGQNGILCRHKISSQTVYTVDSRNWRYWCPEILQLSPCPFLYVILCSPSLTRLRQIKRLTQRQMQFPSRFQSFLT
jgi:hypothetical protein